MKSSSPPSDPPNLLVPQRRPVKRPNLGLGIQQVYIKCALDECRSPACPGGWRSGEHKTLFSCPTALLDSFSQSSIGPSDFSEPAGASGHHNLGKESTGPPVIKQALPGVHLVLKVAAGASASLSVKWSRETGKSQRAGAESSPSGLTNTCTGRGRRAVPAPGEGGGGIGGEGPPPAPVTRSSGMRRGQKRPQPEPGALPPAHPRGSATRGRSPQVPPPPALGS